ncbi:PREDICTED: poly [ADP-ribose] polymerase 12-like [Nanorana parkeri]|uniref:poly [ADP-ribose] polymerase 12-like n=1 Tax=Nanorana parkeri TaxID=125878 RepID=UPI000854CB02|nr:PREDICTED: poly [ADP-ribose] polymerase 12-like [Nanorana parkeri]
MPLTKDEHAEHYLHKVSVLENSGEFSNIVKMFNKTVSGHVVKKLWRVQNPSLWQIYQWQKDQMKKKNSGIEVDERQLFHGTDNANIDAICRDNFDWRICGTNGTVYGQGSYFARDASYSHNYTSKNNSVVARTMFVARVLVGDFVVGDSSMRRPPLKRNGTQIYDSCVDNIRDPSIFVVFEKLQIYPEYILEYEEEKKSSCVIS